MYIERTPLTCRLDECTQGVGLIANPSAAYSEPTSASISAVYVKKRKPPVSSLGDAGSLMTAACAGAASEGAPAESR